MRLTRATASEGPLRLPAAMDATLFSANMSFFSTCDCTADHLGRVERRGGCACSPSVACISARAAESCSCSRKRQSTGPRRSTLRAKPCRINVRALRRLDRPVWQVLQRAAGGECSPAVTSHVCAGAGPEMCLGPSRAGSTRGRYDAERLRPAVQRGTPGRVGVPRYRGPSPCPPIRRAA